MDTKRKSASGAAVSNNANTRLSGSWLIVARAVWIMLVIPSLGLFLANLFAYDQQLQRACVGPLLCGLPGALTTRELQALPTFGFSVGGYAALLTISLALIVSVWCAVGFLIFWRRSDDWLALLAAFFLVMFSITPSGNNPDFVLVFAYPFLTLPVNLVDFLGQISISVFFLFFPNGRLVPRWMGLILLLVIIVAFLNNFPSSAASTFESNWPTWLNLLVTLVPDGVILYSQIYRYRRVSTPVQRQQTKWIILGATIAIGILIGLSVIPLFDPFNINQNFIEVISNFIFYCAFLLFPLSIGFSILRYRLYDIDVLINRTLVYGSLTVLLVALYVGLILVSQVLVHAVTGSISQQPLVLVGSTLVIAALFQPLRRGIQTMIDRRFYRRKYNAAKVVATFGATLRTEVDVDTLREQLLAVVEETMQPAHVSLWIRPAQQDGKHTTAGTGTNNSSHMGPEE